MANLNTVATRQRAAAVLGSVFGGTRGATMELLDKAPFAVVLADDGKIASVCVFEIVPATDDYPTSWGHILFLGTDPKYQAKGYGKTAVAAALHTCITSRSTRIIRTSAVTPTRTTSALAANGWGTTYRALPTGKIGSV